MKTFLLLWILILTGLGSAQMDQQCCPHKKSATLVPAFTVTPTTTTLITNHTMVHPTTNHTTAPPTNHTTALPTNHTTAPPTNHTTAPPTNHTTALPTNHTTAPPTNHTTPPANHTSAHPTSTHIPAPTINPNAVGDYNVSNGSDICLRVVMGIQLQFLNTANQQWETFYVPVPPRTSASGNCTNDTATLQLSFPKGHLHFTFLKNTTKKVFYLSRVHIILNYSSSNTSRDTELNVENSSLQEFETPLGKSYKCKETKIDVNKTMILEGTQVQVQAFNLTGGQFGEAIQCAADAANILVPIIVIVVLIVLVAIVIITYVVGRKRTHSGYQAL